MFHQRFFFFCLVLTVICFFCDPVSASEPLKRKVFSNSYFSYEEEGMKGGLALGSSNVWSRDNFRVSVLTLSEKRGFRKFLIGAGTETEIEKLHFSLDSRVRGRNHKKKFSPNLSVNTALRYPPPPNNLFNLFSGFTFDHKTKSPQFLAGAGTHAEARRFRLSLSSQMRWADTNTPKLLLETGVRYNLPTRGMLYLTMVSQSNLKAFIRWYRIRAFWGSKDNFNIGILSRKRKGNGLFWSWQIPLHHRVQFGYYLHWTPITRKKFKLTSIEGGTNVNFRF